MHVLIAAFVISLIAAGTLNLLLQPAAVAAQAAGSLRRQKSAEDALSRLSSAWRDQTCASDPGLGVSCSGSGCSCACTISGHTTVSSEGPEEGPCALTVNVP